MDTMQGNGSLSTKDLSLNGVKVIDQIADAVKKPELKDMKVKDMTLDFTIKEGRVSNEPFDIKLGDYVMNLSGSTGLDQSIDYSGKIKLPASAGDCQTDYTRPENRGHFLFAQSFTGYEKHDQPGSGSSHR